MRRGSDEPSYSSSPRTRFCGDNARFFASRAVRRAVTPHPAVFRAGRLSSIPGRPWIFPAEKPSRRFSPGRPALLVSRASALPIADRAAFNGHRVAVKTNVVYGYSSARELRSRGSRRIQSDRSKVGDGRSLISTERECVLDRGRANGRH